MSFFCTQRFRFDLNLKTYVMGILNVTPDSFSDGGKYFDINLAVNRAIEMENDGADIIDIGGQSTRPGYKLIDWQEEWDRVKEVLKCLRNKVNIPISIDTFYSEIAERALDLGADIINDVSGLNDKNMVNIVSKYGCGVVVMHSGSKEDIHNFFKRKSSELSECGIPKEKICYDVGIGFGKTREEDFDIIKNISDYKIGDNALLVGLSRKRIIGNLMNEKNLEQRDIGTIAANNFLQMNGVNIIRVHNVKLSVQATKVIDKLKNGELFS